MVPMSSRSANMDLNAQKALEVAVAKIQTSMRSEEERAANAARRKSVVVPVVSHKLTGMLHQLSLPPISLDHSKVVEPTEGKQKIASPTSVGGILKQPTLNMLNIATPNGEVPVRSINRPEITSDDLLLL